MKKILTYLIIALEAGFGIFLFVIAHQFEDVSWRIGCMTCGVSLILVALIDISRRMENM